jgi:peptidoglycan hydrolase-like protein with peptidoglycan-binding domain
MAFSLSWLPEALKNAGLKVALVDGWETRGLGDVGGTLGVICHHTGGSPNGNMPTLDVLIRGRPDLTGPLAQLGLGRDGTYYVIAAGRCQHAGKGSWKGVIAGNTHFIGIEAEHTGRSADPWPAVQMDAYQRGAAAILKHAGQHVDDCIGHKEWAPGRKPDPTFDMAAFRARIAAIMNGSVPAPVLIPAAELAPNVGGEGRVTLRRGATGALVETLQRKLGLTVDGSFGPRTEAAVREFQRSKNMIPDGIIGPKSWAALDATAAAAVAAAQAAAR